MIEENRFTVILTREMREYLDRKAANLKVSVGWVIRDIIEREMENDQRRKSGKNR